MRISTAHPMNHAMKTMLNSTLRALTLGVCLLIALVHRAAAQNASPPDLLSYQGFLADGNGAALAPSMPVNHTVVFRIFAAPSGGTTLWSEQQVVTVDRGNFSVALGEGTQYLSEPHGALSSLFDSASASDRYIETTVTINGTPTTLAPRLRFLPSAYAFLATKAITATTALSAVSAGAVVLPGGAGFNGGQGGSLELGASLSASQVPFIDFHYGVNQVEDFNVRMINDGNGRLSLYGPAGIANGTTLNVAGIVNATDFQRNGAPLAATLWNAAGNHIYFTGGNLGIGTGSPGTTLDVNGIGTFAAGVILNSHSVVANDSILFGRNTAGTPEAGLWLRASDNGTYLNYGDGGLHIRNKTSAETMTMTPGGSVGIGTANPAAKLHLAGALMVDGGFNQTTHPAQGAWLEWNKLSGDGGTWLLNQKGGGSGGFTLGEVDNANTVTSRLKIDGGGNVGIGTTAPTAKLDVNGNIAINGDIAANANILMGDQNAIYGRNTAGALEPAFWSRAANGTYLNYGDTGFHIRNNSSAEMMTITAAGNVGIGTASPATKFHIQASGDPELSLQSTDNSRRWTIQASGQTVPALNGSFQIIDRTAGGSRMMIMPNGFVGIGMTPGFPLDVNGVARVALLVQSSDARLKEKIETVTNALSVVAGLRGVHFDWRQEEFPNRGFPKGRQLGFIAQEVQKLLPEVVSKDGEGHLAVNYTAVVPVLVEAIKEQQKDLDAKSAKIQSLEKRLAALEATDKARSDKFAALEMLVREKLGGVQRAGLRADRAADNN